MKDPFFAALIAAAFWAAVYLMGPAPSAAGLGKDTASAAVLDENAASESEAALAAEDTQISQPAALSAAGFDEGFSLPVLVDGEIRSMDLHEYLTGVLLCELPSDFAPEAQKAQAVASRTYALRRYARRRHGAAALCTDSACCQGWVDPGTVPQGVRAQAGQAVAATDGLVVRAGGELIDATFFSCSGGRTEAAVAVWGSELSYLQAVDSPGEEAAAHFTDERAFPLTEFCSILRAADPEVDFPADPEGWIGAITRTDGGGVQSMELGGRVFAGTELRRLFGLRSTDFTLRLGATQAVFTTRGSGHRVGLSQYGADAMARNGADFREILTYYYRGVTVEAYLESDR